MNDVHCGARTDLDVEKVYRQASDKNFACRMMTFTFVICGCSNMERIWGMALSRGVLQCHHEVPKVMLHEEHGEVKTGHILSVTIILDRKSLNIRDIRESD
jgi:hypothetical protein